MNLNTKVPTCAGIDEKCVNPRRYKTKTQTVDVVEEHGKDEGDCDEDGNYLLEVAESEFVI